MRPHSSIIENQLGFKIVGDHAGAEAPVVEQDSIDRIILKWHLEFIHNPELWMDPWDDEF